MGLESILLVGALGGFVQGLSGFAFGLVTASLWAWMMEPQQVVPLVVFGSFLAQCTSITSVRDEVSAKRIAPFVLGGVFGLPLGISLLQALNINAFRAMLGLGLVTYCIYMLRGRLPKTLKGTSVASDTAIGFASGIVTGACGMGGPIMTVWCSLRDWSGRVQRATFQGFFIVTQLVLMGLFLWRGLVDWPLIRMLAILAPIIIATSWVGSRVGAKYSHQQFRKLMFSLLLLSGIVLLLPSASQLINEIRFFVLEDIFDGNATK